MVSCSSFLLISYRFLFWTQSILA